MKVLVTSDLHGKLAGLDPKCADLVLVASDFSRRAITICLPNGRV